MSQLLDATDRRLLDTLQVKIPLVSRPFGEIGRLLGLDEDQVLQRIAALKAPPGGAAGHGLIRQMSAIFDSRALGYHSTLVAAMIDESRLDQAVAAVNAHPGVSHNYRRDHAFNLWYTLAVPPDSQLGLERTVDILHRQSGAASTRMLPTLKLYKIGVKFSMSADTDVSDAPSPPPRALPEASAIRVPSSEDQRLIRILQQDLPLVSEPFAIWAAQAGLDETTLLNAAERFLATGLMRRFCAVLRHRQAGISANAMGVWVVPPESHDAFGAIAATYSAVSHCYLRRSYPDWPYSLFTMVHARSHQQCQDVLQEISLATGITQFAALYSTQEYKKVRVRYFTPETLEWESRQ